MVMEKLSASLKAAKKKVETVFGSYEHPRASSIKHPAGDHRPGIDRLCYVHRILLSLLAHPSYT